MNVACLGRREKSGPMKNQGRWVVPSCGIAETQTVPVALTPDRNSGKNQPIEKVAEMDMRRFNKIALAFIGAGLIMLSGCQGLVPKDTASLFLPRFQKSEVIGFLAGFGTTFAALPDLIAMFRRRSSAGMNPRMAAIMAVFQILWVYYGLLIASRPVIAWNVIAVLTNSFSVGAYLHFVRKERRN